MTHLLIVVCIAITVGRAFVTPGEIDNVDLYKTTAHFVTFTMLGAWLVNRSRLLLWLWVGLTVVEVVFFALGRI